MGTVDFQTQNTFDRRIGRRLVLDGIDVINVTWIVPQHGRFGRAKAPQELPGRIENVSITGAAIVGPSELGLSTGDEAVVRCGGRDSIVSIRHAQPCDDDRTTRYGVEITRAAPNLKRRIQELLDPTLARVPAEAPAPGLLSLRGGVARPTVAARVVSPTPEVETPDEVAPDAPPTEPADALTAADDSDAPTVAEAQEHNATPDDHVVLDLTDATMAAEGGAAVLDLTVAPAEDAPTPIPAPVVATDAEPVIVRGPEPEPEPAVEAEPVVAAEPVALVEPETVIDPDPVIEAALPIEPEAPVAPAIDPHVPVAHPAHLPPVEMSEGRRVLDEVFGLMED